ncbi:hypothetical protein HDU67_005580 [Dinochytrium kinnereticum]|nr:hypothetical protein HDU67_005580 [Dinochytrium kinnereticum]
MMISNLIDPESDDETEEVSTEKKLMDSGIVRDAEDGGVVVELPEPPKCWTEVPRRGAVVEGFLPFKVPLAKEHQMDEEFVFTPEMFVGTQKKNGVCDLQMIINLGPESESQRYNPSVWEKHQITYLSFPCSDPYMPPAEKDIKLFVRTCDMVFRKNPDKIIGVHDVLSYNVTGYMIVCYLVESLGWSAHRAVEAFRNARSPGIYSSFMLDSLYSRYSESMPLNSRYPDPPAWDKEYAALRTQKKRESSAAFKIPSLPLPRKRSADAETNQNHTNKYIRTSPDPNKSPTSPRVGVHVRTPHLERLIERLCKLLEKPNDMNIQLDPFLRPSGTLPADMGALREGNYWATWKTQGTHYTMMIISEGVFLYSGHGELSHVKITFPSSSGPLNVQPQTLNNTVIQGEMVVDVDHETKTQRFLITDILVLEGQPLYYQMPLRKRLELAQSKLIQPRNVHQAMTRNDHFRVRLKSYVPVLSDPVTDKECLKTGRLASLVRELVPNLPHISDGLVFVPDSAGGEECVFTWTLMEHGWKTAEELVVALNGLL